MRTGRSWTLAAKAGLIPSAKWDRHLRYWAEWQLPEPHSAETCTTSKAEPLGDLSAKYARHSVAPWVRRRR
ncbi:hypothetical protein BQ8482_440007 [Mesorhizobium delmotii]|uniref:Uncharacterized protein n=1 Tax=Mesorhizobium delmotii TaxID=1631247 RepID=A0A2P9ATG1_9HYPH|nr:hypothetical protein BQ8482_440007 [Mesorhizobium delmotii]